MKVLFVENAGNTSAGAFHSLVALIKELQKMGVVAYVALPGSGDGINVLEKNNIPYIKINACKYIQMLPKQSSFIDKVKMFFKDIIVKISSIKLALFVLKNNIDIIHENTSVSYIGYYASKLTKRKHVWHLREFVEEDFNCILWRRKRAIKRFDNSAKTIAISKAIFNKYHSELHNLRSKRTIDNRKSNLFTKGKI